MHGLPGRVPDPASAAALVVDIFLPNSLVFIDPARTGGFWLLFMVIQTILAGYALRMDRERLRPLWTLPLRSTVASCRSHHDGLVGGPLLARALTPGSA